MIAGLQFLIIEYVGYEGGPDTFGVNSIQAKKQASNDIRMTNITINFLNDWYAAGGHLFNWFTYGASSYDTQYGTWLHKTLHLY